MSAKPNDDFSDLPPMMARDMTLRDWLAGIEKIDDGEEFGWELLETLAGKRPDGDWRTNPFEWFEWSNLWQAKVRYARADSMLAARDGKEDA